MRDDRELMKQVEEFFRGHFGGPNEEVRVVDLPGWDTFMVVITTQKYDGMDRRSGQEELYNLFNKSDIGVEGRNRFFIVPPVPPEA